MSLLAIIPARGGSKGIPNKNIINFLGKPLINYTIEAALNSKTIDQILVSSDSKEIINISSKFKNILLDDRPNYLATDESDIIKTILRIINLYSKFDEIILLQPTSPLRTSKDIDDLKDFKSKRSCKSVVSISQSLTPPELIYRLNKNDTLLPILNNENNNIRRQEFSKSFQINGAMYLADKNWIQKKQRLISKETIGFEMPIERSVDIDTILDLKWAKFLFQEFRL